LAINGLSKPPEGLPATFSTCRTYRYHLAPRWGSGTRTLAAIGLNPGDKVENSPTVRNWIRAAKGAGFDALSIVNLFAYRTTAWQKLLALDDATRIGPENDASIRRAVAESEAVLVSWGAHGDEWPERVRQVVRLVNKPMLCLGTTQTGQPRHPQAVKASRELVSWVAPWSITS
jgi:hypothetical protein